jgi:dynein heavy chain
MIIVTEKKVIADEIAQKVGKEEAVVQEAVDKANVIKDECEGDLALALPILEAAEAALNVL